MDNRNYPGSATCRSARAGVPNCVSCGRIFNQPDASASDQGRNHMKYIKMLGLAAMAAMALMAFVGAGTASATTLEDSKGVHPTTISASLLGSATLESTTGSPPTVFETCTTGTVHGNPSTGSATTTVTGV